MKIVILALLVSSIGFASTRENRWKGTQNPNKIEKIKESNLKVIKHSEKSQNSKKSLKVKYKSVSL